MKTSDDYTACVELYPRGGERKQNIFKPNLDTVDTAVTKLRSDLAAWVRPEDVAAVRAAIRGDNGPQ